MKRGPVQDDENGPAKEEQLQIPPLRFAPVGMTASWVGNGYFQGWSPPRRAFGLGSPFAALRVARDDIGWWGIVRCYPFAECGINKQVPIRLRLLGNLRSGGEAGACRLLSFLRDVTSAYRPLIAIRLR